MNKEKERKQNRNCETLMKQIKETEGKQRIEEHGDSKAIRNQIKGAKENQDKKQRLWNNNVINGRYQENLPKRTEQWL